MTKRTESWAVLDVKTGQWSTACSDCAAELRPALLPSARAWAAWRGSQPVLLVPQRAEQLHRGDGCDLCLASGRHRMWSGARWVGSPHPHAQAGLEPAQAPAEPAPALTL